MGPPVEWSRYGADADPSLDPVQWAANMQEIFSQLHDSDYNLKYPRHFIPIFVLHMFCKPAQGKPWTSLDKDKQTHLLKLVAAQRKLTHTCPSWQMVSKENQLSEDDTFLIYDTDTKRFDKLHWAECFKYEDAYQKFFDKFTSQDLAKDKWTFKKFETLQKVDKQTISGLCTSAWNIYGVINEKHAKSMETVMLKRSDIWDLRKNLFLITFLRNRDRNTHMIGTFPNMEDAKEKRQKFMAEQGMGHPRDVWLHNAATILETPHHQVGHSPKIFDFDREDYRANARERFLVFWEAGPHDEFILTDNSFGAFEGCLPGSKHGMTINMKPSDYSKRLYTRDFMWHQLFVLSPKLVVALCHGTLMNASLTRLQRGRYGLRPSVLDKLPHPLPENYYKDMHTEECRFIKQDWDIPDEVKDMFGKKGDRTRYVANLDSKASSDIEFKVSVLSTAQVALVNMILLQNQSSQTTVDSIVYRNPAAIYRAIDEYEKMDWSGYTEEKQNSYRAFRKKIFSQFNKNDPASSSSPISPLTKESKSKPASETGQDETKTKKPASENGQTDDVKSRKSGSESGKVDDAKTSKSEPKPEKVKVETPLKKDGTSTPKLVETPLKKVGTSTPRDGKSTPREREPEQPLLELVADIEAAVKKEALIAKATTEPLTKPITSVDATKSESKPPVQDVVKPTAASSSGASSKDILSTDYNSEYSTDSSTDDESDTPMTKSLELAPVPSKTRPELQHKATDRSKSEKREKERNDRFKESTSKSDSERPKATTSRSDDKPRRSRSKGALERPEIIRASRTETDKRPELVRASKTEADARRPEKTSQMRLEREREKVRQDKRDREREKENYERYEREKEKERIDKEKERLQRDKERLEKQKLEREKLERQALEKERQELERQKREFAKEKEELLKSQMAIQTVARLEKEKARLKAEELRVQMDKMAKLEDERKMERAREKEVREMEKKEKERLANEQKEENRDRYEREMAIETARRQREKEGRSRSRFVKSDRSELSDDWDSREARMVGRTAARNHSPKSEPAGAAQEMRYNGDMTPPSSSHSHPDNQHDPQFFDTLSSQSPPSPGIPYDYPPSPPRRQEQQPQSPKRGNRVSRMLLPGFQDSPPSSGFPSYPNSPLDSPHLDLAPYQAPKESRKEKRQPVRRFESPSPLPALDSFPPHAHFNEYRQMVLPSPNEGHRPYSTLADKDDTESWDDDEYDENYGGHHTMVRYDQPKNRRLELEAPPPVRRNTSPVGLNNKTRRSNGHRFDLR